MELIRSGANLNIADYESGYTPLHRALYFRNLRIAVLLMKAGATLDCVEREEFEALRASVSCKKQVGRRHIANIDNEGLSPLGLLSTSLQSQLAQAADEMSCTSIFAFGKADFQLGMDLPNQKTHVPRAKNVESLNLKGVISVAAARWHSVAIRDWARYTPGGTRNMAIGPWRRLNQTVSMFDQELVWSGGDERVSSWGSLLGIDCSGRHVPGAATSTASLDLV